MFELVQQISLNRNHKKFYDSLAEENLSETEKMKIASLFSLKSQKLDVHIPESAIQKLEESKFVKEEVDDLFSKTIENTGKKTFEYEIESVIAAAKSAGFKERVVKKDLGELGTQVTAINGKGESVLYLSNKTNKGSKVFIDTQGFEGKSCAIAVKKFKNELAKRKIFIEEKKYTFHGKRKGILNEIISKVKLKRKSSAKNTQVNQRRINISGKSLNRQ